MGTGHGIWAAAKKAVLAVNERYPPLTRLPLMDAFCIRGTTVWPPFILSAGRPVHSGQAHKAAQRSSLSERKSEPLATGDQKVFLFKFLNFKF